MKTTYRTGNTHKKIHYETDWNVLEIGSGHNPNKRSNVLIDISQNDNTDRAGKLICIDSRPFIIADAQYLPFKDDTFDYIIASHVAEHVDNPTRMCNELMRVGKRGYIETPSRLGDYMFNEQFHKWIVYSKNKTLMFKKKFNYTSIPHRFYLIYYYNTNRTGVPVYTGIKHICYKIVRLPLRLFFAYTMKRAINTQFEWSNKFKYNVNRKCTE